MRTTLIVLLALLPGVPVLAHVDAAREIRAATREEPPFAEWIPYLLAESATGFAALRRDSLSTGLDGERRWAARLGADSVPGIVLAYSTPRGDDWVFSVVFHEDATAPATSLARDPQYVDFVARADAVIPAAWVREPRDNGMHFWRESQESGGRYVVISVEVDPAAGRSYLLTVINPAAPG